jgi:deoxyribose-phosphate aldolase
LTNLSSSAKESDIKQLCGAAAKHKTAAVCVNPIHVETARETLPDDGSVKLASVAGGFPLSQTPLDIKTAEVTLVRESGADEIDVVVNQGAFISGDVAQVRDEIRAMRHAAGKLKLKVILETCELPDGVAIELASRVAIDEGADFIKTSTGFGKHGATFEHVAIMLGVIREIYNETGVKIGMKPAGGMKSADDALTFAFLVEEVLGEEWLVKDLFRYGASSLLANLCKAIELYYGGQNPITGEQVDGLLGPMDLEPSIEFEFPGLIPYERPDAAKASRMAHQLTKCLMEIGATGELWGEGWEVLRIARFLSAETGFSLDDSFELLNELVKTGGADYCSIAWKMALATHNIVGESTVVQRIGVQP